MFIVLLKFSDNKAKAGELMQAHNEWIRRGLDEGIFLLVGSLRPSLGGALLAHNTSLDALRTRVDADPFVAERVVTSEMLEISPSKVDPRLEFLN